MKQGDRPLGDRGEDIGSAAERVLTAAARLLASAEVLRDGLARLHSALATRAEIARQLEEESLRLTGARRIIPRPPPRNAPLVRPIRPRRRQHRSS
jgi:hypothetical protein